MAKKDVNTILNIAKEEIALITKKTNEKHELIDETAAQQKRNIVIKTAKKLWEAGVKPSLILSTIAKALTDKNKGMSRATVYRALQSDEYKQFKDSRGGNTSKKSLSQMRQKTEYETPPATISVSNSGSTTTTEQPKLEPESPPTKTETAPKPITIDPHDDIAASTVNGERNRLINTILDDISGIDEIKREEIIKQSTSGAAAAIREHCGKHIFEVAYRVPELQVQWSLNLIQKLVWIAQEYEQKLHDRSMKLKSKSRLDSV